MDSIINTNRKGFIKRAAFAFAGIFAFTSTSNIAVKSETSAKPESQVQSSIMARIQTAKGAVARKA